MLKPELVAAIADKTDLSKEHAGHVLATILEEITTALAEDESVTLIGFSTFVQRHRGARMGKNPQTNQSILIPASNTVAFKPGKRLKEVVAELT